MDDGYNGIENSNRVDSLVLEGGPGEEAANFSARAQQDKFLGGGGPKPEAEKPSPTKASEGFLKYWFNNELKPIARILPYAPLGLTVWLGGNEIPADIARGDYRSAAIKGVIAGLSAAPAIIKGIRTFRNI